VRAVVLPAGRTIAVFPLAGSKARGVSAVDGVVLAEFAAMELRKALPGVKVLGPSAMREALQDAPDEARAFEIGRDAGAQLLLVGEITHLDVVSDPLLQSREGFIGLHLRVRDVGEFPPKRPLAEVNWGLSFPEEAELKFETQFASMDAATFRREVLRFAAKEMAGLFYDHVRKERPVSRYEVRWRVE